MEEDMCEPKRGSGISAPVIVGLSVAALAVWVVAAVVAAWQVIVIALAVCAVLVVPVTLALRWSARLSVVHWENAPQSRSRARRAARVYWEGSVLPWRQAAIAAPPRAIGAPPLPRGVSINRKEAVR